MKGIPNILVPGTTMTRLVVQYSYTTRTQYPGTRYDLIIRRLLYYNLYRSTPSIIIYNLPVHYSVVLLLENNVLVPVQT
jgi:hypothetical protein